MRTHRRLKLNAHFVKCAPQLSRADPSHRRVYHSTAHVPSSEAPSRFAERVHVHPGSGFRPVSSSRGGTCTNHIPDVLIRIKRDLNNAEEATRSATLGADLTHVASLAESFSQLRSRNSTVKSDLVDALDREGQFSTFLSFLSLTQHDDKRMDLGQASIFGMLLELSLQIRWDDRWWPAVSP